MDHDSHVGAASRGPQTSPTPSVTPVAVVLDRDTTAKPAVDGLLRAWWTPLGLAKAAGAVGLLVGPFLPVAGVLSAAGLLLYFTGAVITVTRVKWYSHMAFPLVYAAPVAGALVPGLLS